MNKNILIAFMLLISLIGLQASLPRSIRMPKPTIIPEKIAPEPVAEPEPTVVAPAAEPVVTKEAETAAPEVEAVEAAPVAVVAAEPEKVAEVSAAPMLDEMDIDISAEHRTAVIALLNTLLADEYVLNVKTQNFHWNIKNSMNFNDLHLFFGKMYDEIVGIVDMIAERVRALGGRPLSTMNEFISNARLKEDDGFVPTDKKMIKKLLDDSEAIIRSLRADIQKTAELNDMGTNNMLADLITKHEKRAWMLRSYLK